MIPTLEDLCAKALMKKVFKYRRECLGDSYSVYRGSCKDDYPPWYHKISPTYQELIEDQITKEREFNFMYYFRENSMHSSLVTT
jgi:hypothetical protein